MLLLTDFLRSISATPAADAACRLLYFGAVLPKTAHLSAVNDFMLTNNFFSFI